MVKGRPVVLTDNGAPVTPVNGYGEPVTIVGGDTFAVVQDAQASQIDVTGTYVDTVTFTVAGGVITAIVLS